MFTKTHHTLANPPPADADTISAPAGGESPTLAGPAPDVAAPQAPTGVETRRERFRRTAHRSRLYTYAIIAVVLLACVVALAVANTARVKVDWVFGSAHVSLVWLVLCAAILGWLLGLAVTAVFHWRTRAPRGSRQLS